jgi:hypothetical protein
MEPAEVVRPVAARMANLREIPSVGACACRYHSRAADAALQVAACRKERLRDRCRRQGLVGGILTSISGRCGPGWGELDGYTAPVLAERLTDVIVEQGNLA